MRVVILECRTQEGVNKARTNKLMYTHIQAKGRHFDLLSPGHCKLCWTVSRNQELTCATVLPCCLSFLYAENSDPILYHKSEHCHKTKGAMITGPAATVHCFEKKKLFHQRGEQRGENVSC